MAVTKLPRNIFQRMLGLPATRPPKNPECWKFDGGKIEIDLAAASELKEKGGALRLEGKQLPARVLVVRGDDDKYYAFRNHCKHFGRRLDPVPGAGTVQCCSVNASTFDYTGKFVHGPTNKDLETYPVTEEDGKLVVSL